MKATILLLLVAAASAQYYEPNYSDEVKEIKKPQGFVKPLDFSAIFGGDNFGLAGAASEPKDVFKAVVPKSFETFPASSGNVETFAKSDGPQFQSLFDASSASINDGFGSNFFKSKPNEDEGKHVAASYKSESKITKQDSPLLDSGRQPFSHYKVTSKYHTSTPYKVTAGKPAYTTIPDYALKPKASAQNIQIAASSNQKLTPYQKYSFQAPADSKSYKTVNHPAYPKPAAIASASEKYSVPAYGPVSSETSYEPVLADIKGNPNCKRVEKQISADDIAHGRFRRSAMSCYACKDPKTGGNYEQCSFASEPNGKSYYTGSAQSYSSKNSGNSPGYRSKRAASPQYERFGKGSFKSKPEEFDDKKSGYKSPDFGEFNTESHLSKQFGNDDYSEEYEKIKKLSEDQAKEVNKNPKNCKKVQKDNMTCHVCSDPKTGGNYETCSYVSQPKPKKFAYVKERKYDSNDSPSENQEKVTESRPSTNTRIVNKNPVREESRQSTKRSPVKPISTRGSKKFIVPYDAAASTESKSETKSAAPGGQGLDPFLYGQSDTTGAYSDKEVKQESKGYDDYFSHLFPEFTQKFTDSEEHTGESKEDQQSIRPADFKSSLPDFFTDNEPKKDVEKVLAEFAEKDRSACKKVIKNKLTCYQCVDDKGVKHEECMFVAESEPKSSHLAYHEVKEFRTPEKQDNTETDASSASVTVSKDSPKAHKEDATTTNISKAAPSIDASAEFTNKEILKVREPTKANEPKSKTRTQQRKVVTRSAQRNVDLIPAASKTESQRVKVPTEDPKAPTPVEFDVEGSDGAFSAETRPVYSKVLGLTLPKYMLEQSEQEAEFDAVLKSGR